MRGILIAALVLLPAEAHLSGSSTVEATSEYFSVSLESIRPRFKEPDDESRWHREWKEQNQSEVDKLRDLIAKKLPKNKYSLIPYKTNYPEVIEELLDDESNADIVKKPFRCRFYARMVAITVAFATKPPPGTRAALKKALTEILPR